MFHHRNSEITIGMLFLIDFSNIQRYTPLFFFGNSDLHLRPTSTHPNPHLLSVILGVSS